MATRSSSDRCRTAEMMPMLSPNVSHTMTPPMAREIVAGRFSKIWSRTSLFVM
jgi:hypothetical protein